MATQVALVPRTSRLQIDYSVLSLAGMANPRSRYRLDGFDEAWIDAGDRRQALYTNLPPGQFTFGVVTANAAGWNEAGATLSVTLRPAFYRRPAFYGGVALLANSTTHFSRVESPLMSAVRQSSPCTPFRTMSCCRSGRPPTSVPVSLRIPSAFRSRVASR